MKDINSANHVIVIGANYQFLSWQMAKHFVRVVEHKPNAVVAPNTGGSPLAQWHFLRQWSTRRFIDLSKITTYNLDEYYPMKPESPHSYHAYMRTNLFDEVSVKAWHIPNGEERPEAEIQRDCDTYEANIIRDGGLDFLQAGIGPEEDPHMGFNGIGSGRHSRTRLVTLHEATRRAAAKGFGGLARTPKQGITMGIDTMMDTREALVMAFTREKAHSVWRAIIEDPSPKSPIAYFQTHQRVTYYFDNEAAVELTPYMPDLEKRYLIVKSDSTALRAAL